MEKRLKSWQGWLLFGGSIKGGETMRVKVRSV